MPVAGLVGSANLTRAGLTTNQELVLTHKTVPAVEEVDDPEARVILRVPNAWGARYE